MHHFFKKKKSYYAETLKLQKTINSVFHGPLSTIQSRLDKLQTVLSKSNKIRNLIADPYRTGERVQKFVAYTEKRNQHIYTCLQLSQTSLPGIPSCGGVPGTPSWALNGAPSLSVCPLMTRPSLVPSPCGILWNVLLVKENHYPFLGYFSSKVTIQLFTQHLFF